MSNNYRGTTSGFKKLTKERVFTLLGINPVLGFTLMLIGWVVLSVLPFHSKFLLCRSTFLCAILIIFFAYPLTVFASAIGWAVTIAMMIREKMSIFTIEILASGVIGAIVEILLESQATYSLDTLLRNFVWFFMRGFGIGAGFFAFAISFANWVLSKKTADTDALSISE